jgi:glucose/arabinose dehydrogenase
LALGVLPAEVRAADPTVVDPNLAVRTVVSGLVQPTTMAFLGDGEFLVLEKASGKVQRVVGGVVTATVLDLPVNSASERGLLGIALHPKFRRHPWAYLYWTESSTGADSTIAAEVGNPASPYPPGTPQPLGNRVDRFVWDRVAGTLTFDRNVVTLRAYQADAGQPLRGNHNGGVITFERSGDDGDDDDHDGEHDDHDGEDDGDRDRGDGRGRDDDHHGRHKARLFIVIGDNGRRGQTQNLLDGPFGPGIPDDQFGGPRPDFAHLTGVILRINDDGTTPRGNPFFRVGARVGGDVGASIQKVYAYGVRNSFGMAVDPRTGDLWNQENSDDAFDEINRVTPGQNNGWVQVMGPLSRVAEFKAIETSLPVPPGSLQQIRWPPQNIADTPDEARSRLVRIPGAHYRDPVFSWKYAVAPAGIGFLDSGALGREYEGNLFVGAARTTLSAGYLMRFVLNRSRRGFALSDPLLADGVADNTAKFSPIESESLIFGTDFGVGTDIRTGPNGNLYVVSLSNGAVYEIYRK